MSVLTDLHRNILLSCNDDYTGLWEVIRDVQRSKNNATSKEVQRITLEAIGFLLQKGLIRAGFPRRDGSGFDAWDMPNDKIIQRIEEGWNTLDHEPSIGDIVWFVSTAAGDRALAQGKELNALNESEANPSDQA